MSDFASFDDILSYKAHRIITKRIEPYDVIESAKKFCDVLDFTFNGRNKFDIMDQFLNALKEYSKTKAAFGLYMKNVNKFYLLTAKENYNTSDVEFLHKYLITQEYKFTEEEQISQTGIFYSDDTNFAIEQIDMGKAEAVFLINL